MIIETAAQDLIPGDKLSNGQIILGVERLGAGSVVVTWRNGAGDTFSDIVGGQRLYPVWVRVARQDEYTLRDYRDSGGGLYVAADGSPWQIRVGAIDGSGDADLTLVLGDTAYASISLARVAWSSAAQVEKIAADLAETGPEAEANIAQALLAVRRLQGDLARDDKVDATKAFAHKAAAVLGQAFSGTGIPATSLLDGVGTFVVHDGDVDFLVKLVRVEQYAQESF